MKTKIMATLFLLGSICNFANAKLPSPNVSQINKLGCVSKDFGGGGFDIENMQTPDQAVLKLDNGKVYRIFEGPVIDKNKIAFSYMTSSMILRLDKTTLEDDTNYNTHEIYYGILFQVMENQSPEGYPVSSVKCFSMD